MEGQPRRIFLDTNVYIIGVADASSPEFRILRWAGFGQSEPGTVEVVVSEELFRQIRRVAKRLANKDWAGEILAHIWQSFKIYYVLIDEQEIERLVTANVVPKEDIGVYLTASNGYVDAFISANHELIRMLARHTGEFECFTPQEFVDQYLQT